MSLQLIFNGQLRVYYQREEREKCDFLFQCVTYLTTLTLSVALVLVVTISSLTHCIVVDVRID